jgi:hypothetical protein
MGVVLTTIALTLILIQFCTFSPIYEWSLVIDTFCLFVFFKSYLYAFFPIEFLGNNFI